MVLTVWAIDTVGDGLMLEEGGHATCMVQLACKEIVECLTNSLPKPRQKATRINDINRLVSSTIPKRVGFPFAAWVPPRADTFL